jgi:glycosyltransferase involved in cell wall biosynthesis
VPAAGTKAVISFVIPTLNSGRTLAACLASIRAQRLPPEGCEVVVADAGSSDDTLAIAARCGVERIVPNPLRTGEAGKSAGIAASRGELIALVDSDNILPDPGWLERMLAPFVDPEIVGAEPWVYTWRPADPALTRYFALLGMSDPLCLFLGNYDRQCAVTGRWTDLPVAAEDCGDYLKLTLTTAALPTMGANGFVFRRSLLADVEWQPYFFDIDIVQQAVAAGHTHLAKVKCGIVHLYCDRLGLFARKQERRIRDFLYFSRDGGRTYPWEARRRRGLARFCLATATLLPLLGQMARGAARRRDAAWLYHLPVCVITLWVYGWNTLRHRLGCPPRSLDRAGWQSGSAS